jgi:hypothetical protein
MQAHEICKLSLKRLALSNADPRGVAISYSQLLIERRHQRSDDSRPGDLYVVTGATREGCCDGPHGDFRSKQVDSITHIYEF